MEWCIFQCSGVMKSTHRFDIKNGKSRIDFMSTNAWDNTSTDRDSHSFHPNLNVWSLPKAQTGQQGTKGVDNSIPCVTAPTRARSCVSLECKTGLNQVLVQICVNVSLSVALKYLKNNENYFVSLKWLVQVKTSLTAPAKKNQSEMMDILCSCVIEQCVFLSTVFLRKAAQICPQRALRWKHSSETRT